MPWGWECRAKFIKQLPSKPTERKGKLSHELANPGPNYYDSPELFCGKGYSHIKRSPAFTFGHSTSTKYGNSVILPSAPMLDISGMGCKGSYKIKHGIISPALKLPPSDNVKMPGPSNYAPNNNTRYKKAPNYSMRPVARPPYKHWDEWTPSPNMYLPYMPEKKCPPAYSIGNMGKSDTVPNTPAPGAHDPNFKYIIKSKSVYSFGGPSRSLKAIKKPAPNAYCEKKFVYIKQTAPAPSFGIRHSPFLGVQAAHIKPKNFNLIISGED